MSAHYIEIILMNLQRLQHGRDFSTLLFRGLAYTLSFLVSNSDLREQAWNTAPNPCLHPAATITQTQRGTEHLPDMARPPQSPSAEEILLVTTLHTGSGAVTGSADGLSKTGYPCQGPLLGCSLPCRCLLKGKPWWEATAVYTLFPPQGWKRHHLGGEYEICLAVFTLLFAKAK